jgi:hypothetical protein
MCEWIRGGKVNSGARLIKRIPSSSIKYSAFSRILVFKIPMDSLFLRPSCLYSLHVFLSYICVERHAVSYMHMVIYMCSHYLPIDNLLTKLY